MIFLAWYLAIGKPVLIGVAVQELYRKQRAGTLKWPTASELCLGFAVALLVILVWPMAVLWTAKSLCIATDADGGDFAMRALERQDLIREVSVREIEASARVVDPLNAVPDLPFGHLNGVWNDFKVELKRGGSLWAFRLADGDAVGRPAEGYAIVRRGRVGRTFITSLHHRLATTHREFPTL